VTVSSTTNKQSYNGNGSQSVFAYTFKIFADTDINVYVGTTLKSLNTHYTLSGVGDTSGGNVTFTVGNIPAAGTGNVTILRSLALTQGVDLINYGKFDAEVIEAQYDKLTMMVQQLQEQADRTIRFSTTVSDAGGVEITDTVAQRSGKVLAYDSSGDLSVADELGEWKGNWATTTAYVARDLVMDSATSNVYICLVAHTAGTLSSDVTASKWALVVDASAVATSATNAATSATASASSATSSAGSATTSTTKASESATSATNASTSETNAATSATTASTKASEGSTSATNAATSATNSATSATASATSATASSTSATASANSASSITGAETNSAASATAAAGSATTATTQATTATTQASTATTKASEASTSATNAATSETNAAASYDSFDDRYLGAKSSTPTVDNDGSALITGALYFNTTTQVMSVWDSSAWAVIAPSAANQANVDIVAGNIVYSEDLGSITAAVTTATGNSIDVVGAAITNVNTVAGAVANVNAVGADIANVNTVASNNANVTTVAGSIADVNRYANEYKIAATAPAGPSAGDLWLDTAASVLKYYTGSAWSGIISGITDVVSDTTPQFGGALDGQNNNMTNIGTVSGSNLQIDFGSL